TAQVRQCSKTAISDVAFQSRRRGERVQLDGLVVELDLPQILKAWLFQALARDLWVGPHPEAALRISPGSGPTAAPPELGKSAAGEEKKSGGKFSHGRIL